MNIMLLTPHQIDFTKNWKKASHTHSGKNYYKTQSRFLFTEKSKKKFRQIKVATKEVTKELDDFTKFFRNVILAFYSTFPHCAF